MQNQSTILLVEDEVLIRFATAEILRDEGFQVIEAASGDEAWKILEASPGVDLVVTDISMPGAVDGLKLAAMIKASTPAMPVLIVTSYFPEAHERCFDQILTKPVLPSKLLRAVKELVGSQWQAKIHRPSASL